MPLIFAKGKGSKRLTGVTMNGVSSALLLLRSLTVACFLWQRSGEICGKTSRHPSGRLRDLVIVRRAA